MGLVGMSDDASSRCPQTWIVLALIGWVILMVVSWFLIRPALTDTSDAARGPAGHRRSASPTCCWSCMLYLMVFKPGSTCT